MPDRNEQSGSVIKQRKKGKKSCASLLPLGDDDPVETQLLSEMASQMSEAEIRSIRKQCETLLAKISSDEEKVLPIEEVIKIVQDWKPKQEVLCLYVRIARKLPANFHLDSISTLLSISKQCGYTPVRFLTKAKTLQVSNPLGIGSRTTYYGNTFTFITVSAAGSKGMGNDGNEIDRALVGLSMTLTLLEHTVANSCGIIGREGMRSSKPREPVYKSLDIGQTPPSSSPGKQKKLSFKTMPSHEFHKKNSLLHRLWLAINHRWMAYHLVENLFDTEQERPKETTSILIYSFMMHSDCGKSRYDFLCPMVGICLRYVSTAVIEANRTRLDELWKNPTDFLNHGNSCFERHSQEKKTQIFVDTFASIRSQFKRTMSYLTTRRTNNKERRWLMLRGYIFSSWLKRPTHQSFRAQVEAGLEKVPPPALVLTKRQHDRIVDEGTVAAQEDQTDADVGLEDVGDEKNSNGFRVSKKKLRRLFIPSDGVTIEDSQNRLWFPQHVNKPQPEEGEATVSGEDNEQAGNPLSNSHSFPDPTVTKTILLQKDWATIKPMSQSELDQVMASYLLVHTDNWGMDILSKLSTIEVYSADRLKHFLHGRLCGPPGYEPRQEIGDVVLRLGATGFDEYIDKYSKLFHIAKQGSTYFKEYKRLLPSEQMFSNLCKSIVTFGTLDCSRSKGQYRVDIGCGGQHFPNGIPATLVGKGFGNKLDSKDEFDKKEILSTIGMLVQFLWCVGQEMQSDAKDGPLAPDRMRWEAYGKHLCDYLYMDHNVGFEHVTLVMSPISSCEYKVVTEHKDKMNDDVGGYTRTCVFNTCFSIGRETEKMHMLMQVIGNFRKVVGQFIVPFKNSLHLAANNGRRYLDGWRSNMQDLFGGVSNTDRTRTWDPFDRSNFFLDDQLPFKKVRIFQGRSGKNEKNQWPSIYGDYLLPTIGLSRVMSLSMFIDPIMKLQDNLCTDQRIELAFFCSLLSNPFWFHYVMDKLYARGTFISPTSSQHPMYDVVGELYSTFGAWQGGPHNRWSPCGGSVPLVQLFGAHPTASSDDRLQGVQKLEAIVAVLLGHLRWINSLVGKGQNPLTDLPFSAIEAQWECTRKAVHEILPCQFSFFRISIFTTIVIGCNELKPGPHLKQLMIPFQGSASYKHLQAPGEGQISRKSAMDLAENSAIESVIQANREDCVTREHHDRLMLYLSHTLGRKQFVRDEMECLLCESHPARKLDCCDWFCRNQNIFDCTDDGVVMIRPYGQSSEWKLLGEPKEWSYAFIPTTSIAIGVDTVRNRVCYVIDDTIGQHADAFGSEVRRTLEKLIYNGRRGEAGETYENPFAKQQNGFTVHHYRSANMFSSEAIVKKVSTKKSKMLVLGNGEKAKDRITESNTFESFVSGKNLLSTLRKMSGDAIVELKAGCLHLEVDDDRGNQQLLERVTYFPGHLDKCYMDLVQFLPLSGREFFTFLAVDPTWEIRQDEASMAAYLHWLALLPEKEANTVKDFGREFERDAGRFLKLASVTPLVYWNKLGSILQFPSNICFHATVIPALGTKPTTNKVYRDLLILHPLIEA
ncbi:MAG: hypothetical protein ACKOB3_02600 [Holophagaceae bacterium]